MRANLAYLNSAVNETLDREIESPPIPQKVREKATAASFKVVAGLSITDPDAAEEVLEGARAERRTKIAVYQRDRQNAHHILQERGIKPLAVLPKGAWEGLCYRSHLFRLSPGSHGDVCISTRLIEIVRERAEKSIIFHITLLCAGFMGLGGLITWSFLGAILSGLAFAILAHFAENNPTFSRDIHRGAFRSQVNRLINISWRKTLYDLFPGGESPTGTGLNVQLVLPKPPPEVESILRKAKSLRLKVAAVPEAITFLEPLSTVLLREHDRQVEEYERQKREELQRELEKRLRFARENDPIVYCEYGGAVAIIAQFGDFPIEKEVIDEVVHSEHLL